ncbi:MAG: hypothetical protein QOF84_4508, partial [Streptomyces sp.]|nr:hypothetical protein [Streptomyces sp.]
MSLQTPATTTAGSNPFETLTPGVRRLFAKDAANLGRRMAIAAVAAGAIAAAAPLLGQTATANACVSVGGVTSTAGGGTCVSGLTGLAIAGPG